MNREPEKQKGHPHSLIPHGDAMKIYKLRRWPLCPWYLRDCEAGRIAVRAVREPLRWAPAVVRAAPALQSAVGRMSADPPGPGCLRVFGCYPFGGALPYTAGTLSRMDERNLRKGDGIVNWGGFGGFWAEGWFDAFGLSLSRAGTSKTKDNGHPLGALARSPCPKGVAGVRVLVGLALTYLPIWRLTWFSCWFSVRCSCLVMAPPF